ncbi:hypothetical protein ICN48_13040 [Polynucleobacter sp. JS-Safj-400b-B2]|uniref:hypothetical protein n=1 Tax=Polynucleobacter sp. JS-Safj-400b-B2 TaxID=2576921 RepID=UPI001C0C6494|nr:hypothetical protein [Polynucleobacter sp. JS-Safj-400b-B2]MBU3627155.1 hypothetical protein [Polynucleobacter sp. JS-Safj-400b-B2]
MSTLLPDNGNTLSESRLMKIHITKKLFAAILLISVSIISFAQQANSLQAWQRNGFNWYESGSIIYRGPVVAMFQVCALDMQAYVSNTIADSVMVAPGTCAYVSGVDLSLHNLSGGAMVKLMR